VSRVSSVRVEVRVSVKIRVSLVLLIGWHKTSQRGVSEVGTRCVGTAVVITRGINCGRFCFWRCLFFLCLCMKYLGNR